MSEQTKQQVRELIAPGLRREGCEVAELLVSEYRNKRTVKLFVYCDGGTTIGECARISRIVEALLDGAGLFPSGYTLEVSSPGLDRPLKTALDFRYRTGETVRIDFVDSRRQKGAAKIVEATETAVRFQDQTGEFSVDINEIEKATIEF
ncbi:MAG TPA: hypothetical protein VN285_11365 [Candidatus Deferrimicrobium sp.]|nr:hypothetical protein [Candidatus Deferrimicrobium sp.]